MPDTDHLIQDPDGPVSRDSALEYLERARRALSEASQVAVASRHLLVGEHRSPESLLLDVVRVLVDDQIRFNLSIVNALQSCVDSLQLDFAALVRAQSDQGSTEEELTSVRHRLDILLHEARQRLPEPFDQEQLQTFRRQLEDRLDALYAEFENLFRGTREEIKKKQVAYLEDVDDLVDQDLYPLVDVGCGRGEWLELLKEHRVPAYGIDVSKKFVELGRLRGLDVRLGDALDHLKEVPKGSIGAITAFHVVEHLEFLTLLEFLDVAFTALRPGGLLLLETPNVANPVVGGSQFYIDPTHKTPLHPRLLEFVLEAKDFVRVELRFLNPAPEFELFRAEDVPPAAQELLGKVNAALFGPQDCAALARRP